MYVLRSGTLTRNNHRHYPGCHISVPHQDAVMLPCMKQLGMLQFQGCASTHPGGDDPV